MIASLLARLRRRRKGRIALQPNLHVIVVRLLRPQQPGESLPLYLAGIFTHPAGCISGVELIGLRDARAEHVIKCPAEERFNRASCGGGILVREAQPHRCGAAGRHIQAIKSRGLGTCLGWVDRAIVPLDEIFVKRVFQIWGSVLDSEQALEVRLVVREQQCWFFVCEEPTLPVRERLQANRFAAAPLT